MFKQSKTSHLYEIRVYGRAAAYLARRLGPELARWAYETVDVKRRMRLSSRRQRALGLGAVAALGLTTAGVVVRRVTHGSDAPTPAT